MARLHLAVRQLVAAADASGGARAGHTPQQVDGRLWVIRRKIKLANQTPCERKQMKRFVNVRNHVFGELYLRQVNRLEVALALHTE